VIHSPNRLGKLPRTLAISATLFEVPLRLEIDPQRRCEASDP
jgi:hypothetical protein